MTLRRFVLAWCLAAAATSAPSIALGDASDVVFDDSTSSISISNGIISMVVSKSSGSITSLKKGTQELMGALNCSGYWQVYLNGAYGFPSPTYRHVSLSADMVDIAFRKSISSSFPLTVEPHYVIRRGVSGFYTYVILQYDPNIVSSVKLEQINLCMRLDPTMFRYCQVADDRWQLMPTPQEIKVPPAVKVMDATYQTTPDSDYALRNPDDPVYTKYNWSVMYKDHLVHGTAGGGFGVWTIQPTHEYINGGPTDQELTVHQTDTTVVLLAHIQAAHYGSGSTMLGTNDGSWTKLYGPWLMYVNEDADLRAMWADAKAQAFAERGLWPYEWLDSPLYFRSVQRGTLTGRLNVTDVASPAGATINLARPIDANNPNWQQQGKDFQFWATADANGFFTIPKVRAGTYTLYAFVPGVLDELVINNITVTAGSTTDLGTVNWTPAKYGRTVWTLGIPDRTSEEFRHGNDFRHWGLTRLFPTDFPSGVNFVIGQSDPRLDWNYVHCTVLDSGTGTWVAPEWNIAFDLPYVQAGTAYLTVAIAGSRDPALEVKVNGTRVMYWTTVEASGGGVPRSGAQDYYCRYMASFSTSLLQTGTNTVTMRQFRGGEITNILYDCIRLEAPFRADINGDVRVDELDLLELAQQWLTPGTTANFVADGDVDFRDFAILAGEYHQ